ncbi:ATP synthase subunit delta [Clostridia bacterium]|nr:ATP synthase subunit delta [Clostridia bacterium]
MDSLTIDNPYGQGMFDAARDLGDRDEVFAELKSVCAVFKENPKLRKFFMLPTVSVANKRAVCRSVFGGQVSQLVVHFLLVLIDKRRIGMLDGIVRHYEKLLDDQAGFAKGILYSVVPIEGDTLKEFEEKTGQALDKKVRLKNRIDKALIGGVRIYADGKLIDASVKTRLENMKQAMLGL